MNHPPVRSINPFPPHSRIDEVMVILSAVAVIVSPVVVLNYGGRALIIWLIGILVVNFVQIVVWAAIKYFIKGERE